MRPLYLVRLRKTYKRKKDRDQETFREMGQLIKVDGSVKDTQSTVTKKVETNSKTRIGIKRSHLIAQTKISIYT